jgi:carboxyl-terminal processing protease
MENFDYQTPPVQEPPRRKIEWYHWLIIALIITVAGFAGGLKMGGSGYSFSLKSFKFVHVEAGPVNYDVVNKSEKPKTVTVDYNLLWNAIDILNKKYIDKPVDAQKLLYGSIKGAVESVGDPYTAFFEPKELESFETGLKGSFEGIGAEINKKDGNIVIVAPIDGAPAQKAGLRAQDIIVQINGTSTQGMNVEDAVQLIRGPKGTQVKLNIFRIGKDRPFDVTITRDTIEVKSVKWEIKDQEVNGKTKKIAVIAVSQFGDDTDDLFNQAVNDILKQSVDGIVVDLRNDPGGYLETSVNLASKWVDSGKLVVKQAMSDGTSENYNAEGNNPLKKYKTVILINGGSASASEIFSGALHDYKLATLVGDKSFGKGSVQQIFNLPDGSGIKVTIAKWITPNGKNLSHNGLDPDIAVKLSDEDIAAGKDPQMDKALEEVTK